MSYINDKIPSFFPNRKETFQTTKQPESTTDTITEGETLVTVFLFCFSFYHLRKEDGRWRISLAMGSETAMRSCDLEEFA